MQQRVRGDVGDRELRLQAVGGVVARRAAARATGVDGDDTLGRRGRRSAQLERRLDRAVGGKAARIRLDPVLVHRRRAARSAGQVPPNTSREAGGAARDRLARHACARRGEARRVQARGGRHPHLQRLAVAIRTPRAGPPARSRASATASSARDSARPSRRAAATAAPAVPHTAVGCQPPLVQGGVAGAGQRRRRLEAGRVGVEHRADVASQLRAQQQRDGRHGRARVHEARASRCRRSRARGRRSRPPSRARGGRRPRRARRLRGGLARSRQPHRRASRAARRGSRSGDLHARDSRSGSQAIGRRPGERRGCRRACSTGACRGGACRTSSSTDAQRGFGRQRALDPIGGAHAVASSRLVRGATMGRSPIAAERARSHSP